MSKIKKPFSSKDWEQCCGKMCKDCAIADVYRDKYGKKKGEKKLKEDKKKAQ